MLYSPNNGYSLYEPCCNNYITNTPTHTASPPTIVDYQQKVLSLEGEQVTLTVKVAGSPTPTITWLFNGKKVKDDYSTEVGKDGSLTLTCVELKHAGTYTFSVSNSMGSVKGCTKLVVHTEDEDCTSAPKVESNPVSKETFGEYVSSLHAHNNGGFIAQYQVINLIALPRSCIKAWLRMSIPIVYVAMVILIVQITQI